MANPRTARQKAYVRLARANAAALLAAYQALLDLQLEWNALAYGDNLPDPTGVDITETGDNYTKAEVGAGVFDTITAITTVLNAGSATNLAKLL